MFFLSLSHFTSFMIFLTNIDYISYVSLWMRKIYNEFTGRRDRKPCLFIEDQKMRWNNFLFLERSSNFTTSKKTFAWLDRYLKGTQGNSVQAIFTLTFLFFGKRLACFIYETKFLWTNNSLSIAYLRTGNPNEMKPKSKRHVKHYGKFSHGCNKIYSYTILQRSDPDQSTSIRISWVFNWHFVWRWTWMRRDKIIKLSCEISLLTSYIVPACIHNYLH